MSTISQTVSSRNVRTKANDTLRVVSSKQSVLSQLKDIYSYRQLLFGLVRKELKVKYKDSVLGFFWSLLNPAFYLAIYYFFIQGVLRAGIPSFAVYLACGLLAWNFFSTALGGATGSIVGNSSIVKKVAFPRAILPLSHIGAALIHFFLQNIVLIGALAIFHQVPDFLYLLLVPFALLALILLTSGIGISLSALNVPFRDTQHFLDLALLAWFWSTPVVYQYMLAAQGLLDRGWPVWIYQLNPVTTVVMTIQRAFYAQTSPISDSGQVIKVLPEVPITWYIERIGILTLVGLISIYVGLRLFDRIQSRFAEDL